MLRAALLARHLAAAGRELLLPCFGPRDGLLAHVLLAPASCDAAWAEPLLGLVSANLSRVIGTPLGLWAYLVGFKISSG